MDEQQLRRQLNEAHRQILQRDNAYRFHEEELRNRDLQIEQLRQQLEVIREEHAKTQAWAKELEAGVHEMHAMQETRAWRLAVRLRSLRAGRLIGR